LSNAVFVLEIFWCIWIRSIEIRLLLNNTKPSMDYVVIINAVFSSICLIILFFFNELWQNPIMMYKAILRLYGKNKPLKNAIFIRCMMSSCLARNFYIFNKDVNTLLKQTVLFGFFFHYILTKLLTLTESYQNEMFRAYSLLSNFYCLSSMLCILKKNRISKSNELINCFQSCTFISIQ